MEWEVIRLWQIEQPAPPPPEPTGQVVIDWGEMTLEEFRTALQDPAVVEALEMVKPRRS